MLPSSTPKRAVVLITAALLGGYLIHDPSHLLSSPAPDVDIVLSSYREDPALVARQIEVLRTNLSQKQLSSRVTLYVKDESLSPNATEALRQQVGADRVHKLPNLGREGGTFLTHIVSNYDTVYRAPRRAPKHVLFAQSILEYPDLALTRLNMLQPGTRFLSLGHYRACGCGQDRKFSFPRMRDMYAMFVGEMCPGKGQLCTYKGQFVVSWKQILSNPKRKYQHLLNVLEAPQSHWIFDDPEDRAWVYKGKKSSTKGPFFGHALERSWPTIFGCTDVSIAERCTPETPEACQCFHEGP